MCLSVCPVYDVLREEQAAPRARVQLIKHFEGGDLSSTPFLKDLIDRCLMCGSCAANCPAGVDLYGKFMEMRRRMVADHGQRVEIRSLIYMLAKEYRLSMGARLANLGTRLTPLPFMKKYGLEPLGLKTLPRFNARPFRKAMAEVVSPSVAPVGKVIYFTGCGTNFLFDDTGRAVVKILTHLGYQVIIPKDQACCAIPMLFHGAVDQAMGPIKQNLTALDRNDIDAVIVDCATCATALKLEYPDLIEEKNKALLQTAMNISAKVTHILPFIAGHFEKMHFKTSGGGKVRATYHAPCHLKNHFHALAEVEALIRRLPFIDYRPAPDADKCCGGGGTFFYEYPEVSRKMVERKITNAVGSRAEKWLTDCPVCRIQLSSRLTDSDRIAVIHPAQVIATAI